jgi:hypothetical protein
MTGRISLFLRLPTDLVVVTVGMATFIDLDLLDHARHSVVYRQRGGGTLPAQLNG